MEDRKKEFESEIAGYRQPLDVLTQFLEWQETEMHLQDSNDDESATQHKQGYHH